jgi:crotonobetainyl-CoA:carnitine CoA-transferase CaiB-like acyl-CoA transferase
VVTGKVTRPSETLSQQNWWDRGSFRTVRDPIYGDLTLQGPVWKMSETPPRIKWTCRPVGADNELIYLHYLGLGKTALDGLRAAGAI